MAGRKLHDPLRVHDPLRIDDVPRVTEELTKAHVQHETRLYGIEEAIREMSADIKHIRAHMSKQSRINDALMEIRVNDAKNVLAQADLLNE